MFTSKIASEGDQVLFKRNNLSINGEVIKVKESSVIVQISPSDADRINIDTLYTVVSHRNYKLLNTNKHLSFSDSAENL
ncbi:DUF2187 family protein [Cytobacillus solani]|uniref:DUF2187 domain-containing protein n=1 Tax=Cytobacillus solani TaxID=1637975 RepID=A0A0Q3QL87_9BACI|nr:DUF2187 family protein [Cytobacillus solani]KOP81799.1 hypothetical protein AMS60_04460 [Bacillus sp. FJAT-21945]KQL18737.1 hypothetical protein AN957_09230 [Cytobacillus solani]USK56718.1 YkvS family protein [Cytobacillus solani]